MTRVLRDQRAGDSARIARTSPEDAARTIVRGVERNREVDLRGSFQPIDGRFHWYGRVAADPELTRLVRGGPLGCDVKHAGRGTCV